MPSNKVALSALESFRGNLESKRFTIVGFDETSLRWETEGFAETLTITPHRSVPDAFDVCLNCTPQQPVCDATSCAWWVCTMAAGLRFVLANYLDLIRNRRGSEFARLAVAPPYPERGYPAAAIVEHDIEGRITAVDGTAITLSPHTGKPAVVVGVNPETTLCVDGAAATLASIRPGQDALVVFARDSVCALGVWVRSKGEVS